MNYCSSLYIQYCKEVHVLGNVTCNKIEEGRKNINFFFLVNVAFHVVILYSLTSQQIMQTSLYQCLNQISSMCHSFRCLTFVRVHSSAFDFILPQFFFALFCFFASFFSLPFFLFCDFEKKVILHQRNR